MTASTFLQLWPSCTILVLLLVELQVPFGPLRRFLISGPHVAASSESGPWYVVGGPNEGQYASPREAAGKLTWPQRVRSVLGDLIQCPWCVGAHVTFWSVLIFVPGSLWDRVCWWGALWASSSGSVVVLDAIAES